MQVNHLILQFSEDLNVLFCNFMRSKLHKIRTFQFLFCTKSVQPNTKKQSTRSAFLMADG